MKKVHAVKRTNKIDNADLFTDAATHHYEKHIKTQSKQTLKFIDAKINWSELLRPIERALSRYKSGLSSAGRPTHELLVIVKCFLLQTIYNLSDPRLEEEIADRRSFQLFSVSIVVMLSLMRRPSVDTGSSFPVLDSIGSSSVPLPVNWRSTDSLSAKAQSSMQHSKKPKPTNIVNVILMLGVPVVRARPFTDTKGIWESMPTRT